MSKLLELLKAIRIHPDYVTVAKQITKLHITKSPIVLGNVFQQPEAALPELINLLSDLSKLTYGSSLEAEEVNEILDSLNPLLLKSDKMTRLVISCIGNICVGAKLPALQRIVKIFSEVLFKEEDPLILTATLKSLSVVLNENSRISNEAIPIFLNKVEKYAFLEDYNSVKLIHNYSEEDSMSDGEIMSNPTRRVRIKPEWKLQIQAFACLDSFTKQSPKQMYAHWSKYLPAQPEIRKSLMYIILLHPSDVVRQAACKVVAAFFTGARQYLSIASHAARQSSFTSLSQQLADQIFVTIDVLLKCLKQNNDSTTTIQLYSLLNTILLNCNLRNLKGNLASLIFDILQEAIAHRDKPAFLIFECLSSLLVHLDLANAQLDQVLEMILKNCDTMEKAKSVAILNLIGSLGNSFPVYLWYVKLLMPRGRWKDINQILKKAYNSRNSLEELAGLRALENCVNTAVKNENLDLPVEWWITTLEETSHLWMSENYGTRCVSCHIIGHLPPKIADHIDIPTRKTIISTVLALAQDEHMDVKAAACGTIGALSYFSWIRADITILSAFARKLPGLCDDTNLKVRIRAFWAVGSLIDALKSRNEDVHVDMINLDLSERNTSTERVIEMSTEAMRGIFDLSTDLKLALLRSTIAGCRDHEKVRSNAFRALGRMIDLIPANELCTMTEAIDSALSALISSLSSGAMKNRWNASYCLKSLFGYPGFPLGKHANYSKSPFQSLIEVSAASTNFKVKTGSILALASVSTFERFETPEDSSVNVILIILRGLVDTVKSIDGILIRATNEEHIHLSQLFDAVSNLLKHLERLSASNWTEEMRSLEIEISQLMDTIGKSKTSFDPHSF